MVRAYHLVLLALIFVLPAHAAGEPPTANRDAGGQNRAEPKQLEIPVWIAELLPESDGAEKGTNDGNSATNPPDMKDDPKAWIAWAEKHRRVEVLSRPIIRSQENQAATIQVGIHYPPDPERTIPIADLNIGVQLTVTPRLSPEGLVVMDIEVQRSSLVRWVGVDAPIIRKTSAQITVTAPQGKTILLSSMEHFASSDDRNLMIALTPKVAAQP